MPRFWAKPRKSRIPAGYGAVRTSLLTGLSTGSGDSLRCSAWQAGQDADQAAALRLGEPIPVPPNQGSLPAASSQFQGWASTVEKLGSDSCCLFLLDGHRQLQLSRIFAPKNRGFLRLSAWQHNRPSPQVRREWGQRERIVGLVAPSHLPACAPKPGNTWDTERGL